MYALSSQFGVLASTNCGVPHPDSLIVGISCARMLFQLIWSGGTDGFLFPLMIKNNKTNITIPIIQ